MLESARRLNANELAVFVGRIVLEVKSWNLENAQKIADEFPYTFYKLSIAAICKKNT